jgi:ABC-2 type transport system permease protein
MSLSAVLSMEFRKVMSTKTWWLLGCCLLAYVLLAAACLTWSYAQVPKTDPLSLARPPALAAIYASIITFGTPFAALLGAWLVTTEYQYGTAAATFLATPRRRLVVTAKAIVALLTAIVIAIACTLILVPALALIIEGFGYRSGLGEPVVKSVIVAAVPAVALWAPIGVGLGFAIRRPGAAALTVIAGTQLVEPLARVALAASGAPTLAVVLPGAATDGLAGGSVFTVGTSVHLLAPPLAGLVLIGYVALALLVGAMVVNRRDVG